jgi:nucleoside 2-deoxyribosyltransferase
MHNINGKCELCGDNAYVERHATLGRTFYKCDACDYYDIGDYPFSVIEKDIYAPFLFYNGKILKKPDEKYFYFIGLEKNFLEMQKNYPYAQLASNEVVEAWFPKTISEKIDKILLGLAKLSDCIGSLINLPDQQLKSLFFVKRYSPDNKTLSKDPLEQVNILGQYLAEQNYVKYNDWKFVLLPTGWNRVDELQKNQSDSKQAFVAMQFSEDTGYVREAIRQGVITAGYIPRFIDEKEHNNQIVPEILYEIRKSKFVIAELTSQNNGAYYEAGYAAGLGKEVIHICNKKIFLSASHFDVKQKSAVLWENETDIPSLLSKRILASIEK